MPKKKVEAHKAGKYWRVYIPKELGGGRKFFHTKKDGDSFAAAQEALRAGNVQKILALTEPDLRAIAHALDQVGWKVDLLVEAAKRHGQSHPERSVADVVDECVAAKVAAGCWQRYTDALELQLKAFAKSNVKQMHEVQLSDVEAFVNAKAKGKTQVSQWTRRARWIDLRTLFSFAVTRGYCSDNLPLKMQAIQIDHETPEILTVDQSKVLLDATRKKHPALIPYVALCLFAGLRPSEAQQLTWDDVKGDSIVVSADRSKGRQRRIVTINETLRAWLALGGDLPVTEGRCRVIRELLTPWPKDGLRHSFVSYHFVLHGAAATSREAGHSEAIMFKHYRELVTAKAAEEYFALTPEAVLGSGLLKAA